MSQVPDDAILEVRRLALRILANMRAHDARFYREYMGVHPSSSREGISEASAAVGVHNLGPGGFVAAGALATMADMTLAAAIRPVVPRGHRTATAGLTIQIVDEAPTERLRTRAEVVASTGHSCVAQCKLIDDRDRVVALATGTFAIRPVPENAPWLPYSRDGAIAASEVPPLAPEELNGEEQWLLRHAEVSATRGSQDGPYADYLSIEWQTRGDGQASGLWPIGPHLWNRVAHVHGGALFGALSVAALACLPDDLKARIIEQQVQYVRPGIGKTLRVDATLLRRGRLLNSVQAQVTDLEGKTIANALVTLTAEEEL